jgi:hypothetical protein
MQENFVFFAFTPCFFGTFIAREPRLRAISSRNPGRGVAQPGSASVLGTEGRRFESCLPDHFSLKSAKIDRKPSFSNGGGNWSRINFACSAQIVPKNVHVLHDTLCRGLRLARVFWSHLRSFVTTMRPKHSLNHNINSVPLLLTGNSGFWGQKADYRGGDAVKVNDSKTRRVFWLFFWFFPPWRIRKIGFPKRHFVEHIGVVKFPKLCMKCSNAVLIGQLRGQVRLGEAVN